MVPLKAIDQSAIQFKLTEFFTLRVECLCRTFFMNELNIFLYAPRQCITVYYKFYKYIHKIFHVFCRIATQRNDRYTILSRGRTRESRRICLVTLRRSIQRLGPSKPCGWKGVNLWSVEWTRKIYLFQKFEKLLVFL